MDRRNSDEIRRRTDAALKLAFLSRYDRLIESYEQLPARTDLGAAEIAAWRERRRREYRAATGVEIEQRDALAALLREVAESGAMTLDEVVTTVHRQSARLVASEKNAADTGGMLAEDWL